MLYSFITCQSQSDNYWSWNFNTPSMLLAGSVVGGSAGPSAIFYNPSIINHESTPSLSISASITSLQSFKAENIAGDGIDAEKLIFKVQPRFLSYVFPTGNERFGLAAAILSPVSEEVSYSLQHFDQIDIINRTNGLEEYSGYLRYSRKYEDIYAGFGFSFEVTDKLYLGSSMFVSTKLMKYQYQRSAEAHQTSDSVLTQNTYEARYSANNSFDESFKYWDISLVFKLGALYKLLNDQLSLGINITLPNISVFGSADVRKAYARNNVYYNEENRFTSNEVYIEKELDARTKIKSPFSIAGGLEFYTKNRKNAISLTLEYFHSVDRYKLLTFNTEEYNNSPPDQYSDITPSDFMNYYTQANAVTNIAIGFKQYFSPTLSVLGGFRTDFTSGKNDEIRFNQGSFKVNQIHIDKYHITAGPIAQIKNFYIVSGLQYTFGSNYGLSQLINYSDPVEYNPANKSSLQGIRRDNVKAKINELSFFIGLTVDF